MAYRPQQTEMSLRRLMNGRFRLTQVVTLLSVILVVFIFYHKGPDITEEVEYFPPEELLPVESIRKDCGELCETVAIGEPGPYFNHINLPINCPKLFSNEEIDRSHKFEHAPKTIPKQLLPDFSMNGRIKISKFYFDERYLGKKALMPVWTKMYVEEQKMMASKGKLVGNYGIKETNALRDGLRNAPNIRGGRVLVIGSERPWVEACVLEAGAVDVVTLEYGKIISEHPQISTMLPSTFRKEYNAGTLEKFDAVVTFSSVEHSGLGRYGDGLNPWGDIIAIARAWCVTKEGGSLVIGVMYDNGKDYIRFNGGRWYGKIRYPYLTTNWKQYYEGHGEQKIYVFVRDNMKNKNVSYYLRQPSKVPFTGNLNTKYSQAQQDELVYQLFPKNNGFFLEIGANDGITFSNTLWLERRHGWSGILIEANPDLCRQIDNLNRHAWRLCACLSNTLNQTKFVQSGTVGAMEGEIDADHMKSIKDPRTVTVPCFSMESVLDAVKTHHIDFFTLDVEGAEMIILESMRELLKSKKLTVDAWAIEYRIFDGTRNIYDKSLDKLNEIRKYFKEIGHYVEHSQVYYASDSNTLDGHGLDVIFVSKDAWCQTRTTLPDGKKCS